MNFCSEMYEGGGYFGGYPSEEEFGELLRSNITTFVDLTTAREKRNLPFVYRVPEDRTYLSFPIMDNHVPKNRRLFLQLVHHIAHRLQNREKVYIHCRGGHGRSGILVASLLCYLNNLAPHHAIQKATMYHSRRPNLKAKWKTTPCPQMYTQQKFVMDLFQPIQVSHTEFDRYMEKNPEKLLHHIGLRPLATDVSTPLLGELLYYIRHAYHQHHITV
uniref:Uncharacterized protein n=1 Tax=viral metagenome TaxID=1070528 RepID=A0A6C0ICM2_9ZZZZ